jgi:hypothetical protein
MSATEGKNRAATGRKGRSAPRVVPHLTAAERAARGRAARAEVPRSSHADFTPRPGRPDPVELLATQAETRVPELVPIRYGRMMSSAFAFYRGAALIMASDLSGSPQSGCTSSSAATRTCPTSACSPRPSGGSCST